MSGGKEKKHTNEMIREQYGQEQKAYGAGTQRNEADFAKNASRNDELYGTLKGQYSSLAGVSAAGGPAGAGGGGGGGGGGVSVPGDPRFKEVEDFYRKLTDNKGGGWDPERLQALQGDIAGIRGQANDPEIARRMRGNGVFEEFSKTGGYSDADKANIRARGTSGVPAMYGRMKDEADRFASVQGGYGPGRAALMSRMGRDQAGAASEASRNAEMGINEAVRTGRMSAAEAMSGAEGRYQSLRGDSFSNAGNMTSALEGDIYGRNRTGFQGIEGRAESDRQAEMSAQSANASAGRAASDDALRRQMMGLEGLHSLFGSSEQGYGRSQEYDLGNRGTSGQIQQGSIDQNMANNPQKSWTDYVGAAAGVAGMFMSSRELKENIKEVDAQKVADALEKLSIYTWRYKGDKVKHIGPMAEEFKAAFGVGDGVTLNIIDVLGVLLAAEKARLLNA